MPDASSNPSRRPDLETARAAIRVDGPPAINGSGDDAPEATNWDKESPTGPPQKKVRPIPQHLTNLVRFFKNIILDESLLLEMCFDQCYEIVRDQINNNMVGTDYWQNGEQGAPSGPFTPTHYAQIAGPMTVELYKNVMKAIEGRSEEYGNILREATREREKNSPSGPKIFVP